jgi:hypothetical protein
MEKTVEHNILEHDIIENTGRDDELIGASALRAEQEIGRQKVALDIEKRYRENLCSRRGDPKERKRSSKRPH